MALSPRYHILTHFSFLRQLFSVVMNLMEALKTSFSERSLQARALGQSDYTADASITAITMLEVMTYTSGDTKLMKLLQHNGFTFWDKLSIKIHFCFVLYQDLTNTMDVPEATDESKMPICLFL